MDRAERRARTDRYKAKQKRDLQNMSGTAEAERHEREVGFSDTRHALDCGGTCFMCSGEKLIFGRRRERYAVRKLIADALDQGDRMTREGRIFR